jgi:hypothetical protein
LQLAPVLDPQHDLVHPQCPFHLLKKQHLALGALLPLQMQEPAAVAGVAALAGMAVPHDLCLQDADEVKMHLQPLLAMMHPKQLAHQGCGGHS